MFESSRRGDAGSRAWRRLELQIAEQPTIRAPWRSAIDEPVRRYLRHALARDDIAAPGARIEMRGRIRLGRWLPFRATQLIAPHHGSVWKARVAGMIVGSDRYVRGDGAMDWRVFGVVPVMRAEGADVSRSAAGRVAGESIWVPSAFTYATGDEMSAVDDHTVVVRYALDDHAFEIRHRIDDRGSLRSSSFLRWGDPDGSGTWRLVPFGVAVHSERTFGDVTIPASGEAGWHFGTDSWETGKFFEFTITDHQLYP